MNFQDHREVIKIRVKYLVLEFKDWETRYKKWKLERQTPGEEEKSKDFA